MYALYKQTRRNRFLCHAKEEYFCTKVISFINVAGVCVYGFVVGGNIIYRKYYS